MNKLIKKQDRLINQINHYIISNPNLGISIPSNSLIVPIDSKDSGYFNFSMNIINRAVKKKSKNVYMAIPFGDKWEFFAKF